MRVLLLYVILGMCPLLSLVDCSFLRLSKYRNPLIPIYRKLKEVRQLTHLEEGPDTNTTSWNVKVNGGFGSTPVITNIGTVIAVSLDGRAFGLTQTDGKILWKTPALGQYIVSSPTLSDDETYVYFTALSSSNASIAMVYSLFVRTGEIFFSTALVHDQDEPTTVFSRPVMYNQSQIMFIAAGDSFYAMYLQPLKDSSSNYFLIHSPGDVLWKYTAPFNKLLSSAAVLGDRVFFTTANRRDITCLDANTGEECWREDLGSYSSSTPVLDKAGHDCLYVGSSGGVHAVSVSAGCDSPDVREQKSKGNYTNLSSRVLWTYSNISMGVTSVSLSPDGSALYCGSLDNRIIAINITRTFNTAGPVYTPVVQWEYRIRGNVRLSAPVVDINGHVFVTTDAGTVYAFDGAYDARSLTTRAADEKLLLWELTPTPISPIFASASLSNGTLFIASSAGNLVAVAGSTAGPVPVPAPGMGAGTNAASAWSAGEIAGLTIGLIVLIVLLVLLILFLLRRKRTKEIVFQMSGPTRPATAFSTEAVHAPATSPVSFSITGINMPNPISTTCSKGAADDSPRSVRAQSVQPSDSTETASAQFEAKTRNLNLQQSSTGIYTECVIEHGNAILAPRIPSMVGAGETTECSDDETLNTTRAEHGGDDVSVFTTASLPFSAYSMAADRSELQSPFDLKRRGYVLPSRIAAPKQSVLLTSMRNNVAGVKKTLETAAPPRISAMAQSQAQLSARRGVPKMALHVGYADSVGQNERTLSGPQSVLSTPQHSPPAAPSAATSSTFYAPEDSPPPPPVPLTPAMSVLTEDQWSPSKASNLEAGVYHHRAQGIAGYETRDRVGYADMQPTQTGKEGSESDPSDGVSGELLTRDSPSGAGYSAEAETSHTSMLRTRVGFPHKGSAHKKRPRTRAEQLKHAESGAVFPGDVSVDATNTAGSATTVEPFSSTYFRNRSAAKRATTGGQTSANAEAKEGEGEGTGKGKEEAEEDGEGGERDDAAHKGDSESVEQVNSENMPSVHESTLDETTLSPKIMYG